MVGRLVGCAVALCLGASLWGCGSSTEPAQTEQPKPSPSESAPTRQTGVSSSANELSDDLRRCLKKIPAQLEKSAPTLDGRIAIGSAGNVPATYVGAVVFKNGAYADMWIADNSQDAVETADALNVAEAESEGVTEVEAAYSNGRVVSAPGNTEEFGELDLDTEAGALDECIKQLN